MDKIIHKRLAAATIIETIVAMVIILVLFGITTTVLVQTSVRSLSIKRIKAAQLVNTLFVKTTNESAFFNEEIVMDEFVIKKEVQNYNGNDHLLAVKIIVSDNSKSELISEQRLIRLK
jgi:type II secretory pathway pseudopilin PulG